VPSGVDVRVEARGSLATLLPGAAVLITGWSNSVYEAVVAGVPALTVHTLASEPPMPFAREGVSVEARSSEEAAKAAAELVSDPGRSVVLRRARSALEPHLGPLDGRATRRTADLVREMAVR
jgi:spore coat polysaccharide biosynthesis predicted glycosyltransferase SpsG